LPYQKVGKGIIIAAGDGDRLGLLTATCPKVLLSADDEAPLIRYPLEALLAAGIRDIAIVIGYLGDKVREVLGNGSSFGVRFHYIYNSDYLGGNAISVYKASDWANGEPVVLCMGDHLIERKLVKRLLDRQTMNETLCVDYLPSWHHHLPEATKVSIDNEGCIRKIGKDLVTWDALDTGVFLLTKNFFQALDKLVHWRGTNIEIADVIQFLVSRGQRFHTCNVTGCFWMDVDTEEDLNVARM